MFRNERHTKTIQKLKENVEDHGLTKCDKIKWSVRTALNLILKMSENVRLLQGDWTHHTETHSPPTMNILCKNQTAQQGHSKQKQGVSVFKQCLNGNSLLQLFYPNSHFQLEGHPPPPTIQIPSWFLFELPQHDESRVGVSICSTPSTDVVKQVLALPLLKIH